MEDPQGEAQFAPWQTNPRFCSGSSLTVGERGMHCRKLPLLARMLGAPGSREPFAAFSFIIQHPEWRKRGGKSPVLVKHLSREVWSAGAVAAPECWLRSLERSTQTFLLLCVHQYTRWQPNYQPSGAEFKAQAAVAEARLFFFSHGAWLYLSKHCASSLSSSLCTLAVPVHVPPMQCRRVWPDPSRRGGCPGKRGRAFLHPFMSPLPLVCGAALPL